MKLSCRICEIRNISFKNIFDDQNSEIIEKLRACTNILLEKDDPLSKLICKNCEVDLNLAYNFRIKCEETDAKLRKKLVIDSIKKEICSNDAEYNLPLIEIEIIDSKANGNENDIKSEDADVKVIEKLMNEENIVKTNEVENRKKNHKYSKLSRGYKCDTCELIIEKRTDYIIHIRSHGKQRFQCKNCSHWCPSKTKLKIHIDEVHNRNGGSVCELCGKTFSNARNLQRHIVDLHEQRKPYKCSSCDQSFARPYILNQHYNTVHSNVRNWQCDECKKTFKLEAQLKLHKKQTHLPEGERLIRKKKYYKKVMCPDADCGKLCQSNAALKDHIRWHTGEKPYQCTVCGKAFALKNALYRHDMVHKGLKPYKCDICQMAFRQSSHLRIHKLTHTGEKPHQCDVCERAFATKGNLTAHRKLHLGIKTTKIKKN